jgi:hypothetical protein
MTTDLFSTTHWQELGSGPLRKMRISTTEAHEANYWLLMGQQSVHLNPYLGHSLQLTFRQEIRCQHCSKVTPKSYQGFCYEHFMSLAQADSCIVSPEKCHFHLGTCREPAWGESQCFQTHYVYLANTGQLKVGITRGSQVPTRWLDQGAESALLIARVRSRYIAGLLEVLLSQHISDKTNWRKMLSGTAPTFDLRSERDRLFDLCRDAIFELQQEQGIQALQWLTHAEPMQLRFPVQHYPSSVQGLNFDRQDEVQGVLLGIKGQYLILDQGCINIRRHTGYCVTLATA